MNCKTFGFINKLLSACLHICVVLVRGSISAGIQEQRSNCSVTELFLSKCCQTQTQFTVIHALIQHLVQSLIYEVGVYTDVFGIGKRTNFTL